ncbi:competence protein ComEA [Blastococcus sp. KM273128]|uniref:helix-hairpin-helix domain-containing protein n=1 Tax=Blastococcus sp. KM273128 TaxID=2570314 RepID=UPI001F476425|nr:helix-hairpin-helix domain-containing protein [Blastococcus sp. KM273128]MCF6743207.1 competence protein ComEA [Blastococcus sp. KM273128]
MRLLARRDDDADVIRARLRAVLAEPRPAGGGWLPDDEDGPGWPADDRITVPVAPPVAEPRPAGGGRHRAPGTAPRWDAGRGGSRAVWTAAAVAVLLLLAWTWVQRPQVEPAAAPTPVPSAPSSAAPGGPVGEAATTAEPAATSAPVVVAVVGQVARPGLVTLPAGARVADAVAAAGGLLPDADPASVNLAAPLSDGQQVAVGVPGAAPAGAPPVAAPGAAGAGGRLDLNTAGVAELDALPGIGPVLAQRIVDHRTRAGGFGSVEELDQVPGIGPAKAAELADLVRV